MSEVVNEETTEQTGTEATEATSSGGDSGVTSAPPSPAPSTDWSGPSQQEWQTVMGALQFLNENGYFAPDDPEEDLEGLSNAELMQRYVEREVGQLKPYVEVATQQAGEKVLNDLLDSFESDPAIGKLSPQARKVAEYAAQAEVQSGRVRDPRQAVRQGAVFAASLTKAERQAAIDEYKASMQKETYEDPGVSQGVRQPLEAKTYEEVISAWDKRGRGEDDVL